MNIYKRIDLFIGTVKPVLRGHLWDKAKVVFQNRYILKEVQFI